MSTAHKWTSHSDDNVHSANNEYTYHINWMHIPITLYMTAKSVYSRVFTEHSPDFKTTKRSDNHIAM